MCKSAPPPPTPTTEVADKIQNSTNVDNSWSFVNLHLPSTITTAVTTPPDNFRPDYTFSAHLGTDPLAFPDINSVAYPDINPSFDYDPSGTGHGGTDERTGPPTKFYNASPHSGERTSTTCSSLSLNKATWTQEKVLLYEEPPGP